MNYNGFYIQKPLGNNEFSYEKRINKKIYVPKIIEVVSSKKDILKNFELSDKIAFSEYENNDINALGLKNFLYIQKNYKKIYIFDNHNHSFYFISLNIIENLKKYIVFGDEDTTFLKNEKLDINKFFENIKQILKRNEFRKGMIHFDQHKDMRVPKLSFEEFVSDFNRYIKSKTNFKNSDFCDDFEKYEYIFEENKEKFNQEQDIFSYLKKMAFLYSNYHLNVGNFIVPLKKSDFIDDVLIVDSTYSIDYVNKEFDNYGNIILDIDLDFFSKDMDYIDENLRLDTISKFYEKANIITICTSPYFIEFERAKKYLGLLLDSFGF